MALEALGDAGDVGADDEGIEEAMMAIERYKTKMVSSTAIFMYGSR